MDVYLPHKDTFIKVDNDKRVYRRSIIWVKKMDECLSICTKTIGCGSEDTHKLCKINNNETYSRLIRELEYSD
jgi:hypothetical protein